VRKKRRPLMIGRTYLGREIRKKGKEKEKYLSTTVENCIDNDL